MASNKRTHTLAEPTQLLNKMDFIEFQAKSETKNTYAAVSDQSFETQPPGSKDQNNQNNQNK